MSYNLLLTDGSILVNLGNNQLDTTTTSLALGGVATQGAERIAVQNLLWLLENCANTTAPAARLVRTELAAAATK